MAFNYAKSKLTADRLIAKFGQAVSIRRAVNSGDDWNPTQTKTDYAAIAAIVAYENREIDGTLILATDQRALIAKGSLTIDPMPKDELVVGSDVFQIVNVSQVNPAGTVVMFEAQVRK